KSRYAKDARRIGGRMITIELASQCVQQGLRLRWLHLFYSPDHLVLVGRGIQDTAGRRDHLRFLDCSEGCGAVLIEVDVEVADGENILLGARLSLRFESVHPDVNVATVLVVFVAHPILERGSDDLIDGSDALDGSTAHAIADQDGNAVGGFE